MESKKNICPRKRIGLVASVLFCLLCFNVNSQLVINEVVARNGGLYYDDDLDCSSIIELYNTSPNPVQLEDYYLSDRTNDLKKWRFPNDLLFPNQRTIVYLSNKDRLTPMHANFSLSIDENIYLSLKSGQEAILVDSLQSISYPYNASIARFPDGIGNYQFSKSTIDSTNILGEISLVLSPTVSLLSGVSTIGSVFTVVGSATLTSTNGLEPIVSGVSGSNFNVIDPSLSPLRFGIIPTNPSLTYPVQEYSESRANDRGWLPPTPNQDRISLIRAQAFSPLGLASEEIVRSVFTSPPTFGLPIISITTDSIGFFDNQTGISVYGNAFEGNYNLRGRFSERLVFIHVFDSVGNLTFETSAGARIKGDGSRHSAMKSLRFTQRDIYPGIMGNDSVFLSNYSLMRSAGHRPDCFGRDYLSHKFVEKLSFLKAKPKYHAAFLNGEFWGLYDLRQNLDEKYISFLFNLPKDQVAIADHTYTITSESRLNSPEFSDLTLFAEGNDLNAPENFAYMQQKLDFEDFIQVNCTQIFLGNGDFPRTNNAWFNVQNGTTSSKWKNIFFDLDGGFGGDCDTILRTFNTLNYYLQTTSGNWIKSTRLLRNLLNNPKFVTDFSNTMADLMNSSFLPNVLLPKYADFNNEIEPNRLLQVERWGYPSNSETLIDRYSEVPSLQKWDVLNTALVNYFSSRQRLVYRHFMNRFLFEDTARISLDVSNSSAGFIGINSLFLSPETEGFSSYPWNGLYFKGVSISLTAYAKRGFKFDSWLNGNTNPTIEIGLLSDSNFTANFSSDPLFKEPNINEVLTLNSANESDEYAQFNAWIELYNPNAFPISLEGYYLTDDVSNLVKFPLKAVNEHRILANDYALFYASNILSRGMDHTNFLAETNTTIYLVSTDGSTILQQLTIPSLAENFSYGSSPNGSLTYAEFSDPTPLLNNDFSAIEQKEEQKKTFSVFPNPTENLVEISPAGNYKVFDLKGNKLIELTNSSTLNLTFLSKGIYVIKNERGVCQRLVKI